MYWCSSAEAEKLVKSVEDAFEKIQRLGPNPISIPGLEASKEEISTTPQNDSCKKIIVTG